MSYFKIPHPDITRGYIARKVQGELELKSPGALGSDKAVGLAGGGLKVEILSNIFLLRV